jgi:hypothetical protein
MSALILATVLAASAPPPFKLASAGFTHVGLSDAQAAFFAEHFSSKLAEDERVRVSTPKDLAALLGVERQKQLLGCSSDGSSCVAELAGALGADGIVVGQVAKVGKSYQLNVKILRADGTRTLFVHSSKLLATEEDVVEELNDVAGKATDRVVELLRSEASAGVPQGEVSVSAGGPARPLWKLLVPVGLGVAALGASAVFFVIAAGQWAKLNDSANWATLPPDEALALRNSGMTNVTVGTVLAGVGVAAVISGVVWYLRSSDTPAVSFFVGPGQGGLLVQGALP